MPNQATIPPVYAPGRSLVRRATRPASDEIVRGLPPARGVLADLRQPLFWGVLTLLLVFGFGGGWAALAPLAGAAIAPGVISPDGSRRTVQHLEGGIIHELLARDGEIVEVGQPLVVLEGVDARAEVGRLRERLRALAATEARLIAERASAARIEFTHPILTDTADPKVAAARRAQANQLEARRAADANREAILGQRIEQLHLQIAGYERQVEANRGQRELIEEEAVDVEQLYRKGLERKARLLALQREQADLLGEEGELTALIARTQEAIGETRLQISDLRIQRMEEIDAEFAKVQMERGESEEELAAARDKLRRTVILAPVAGTVLNSRFKTTGGVIRPGDPILDLMPLEEELIIEARLSPTDIEEVAPGQDAYVMFPSLPRRTVPRIAGQVRSVSADALIEERSGMTYYLAKVQVDRDQLAEATPGVELTPGMPAEVFIATTERTVLEYLLQPITQTFARTFRES
jgi:HlyD family type I secretion membrane fusion protein